MKIENGCVVLEQCGFPGNIGDSCAESARLENLLWKLGHREMCDLSKFITTGGTIRHPDSPWREDDTSSDQEMPLWIALKNKMQFANAEIVKQRTKARWWKTGNGDFINPMYYCLLNNWKMALELIVRAQIKALNLPYRWSDSKKWFEKSDGHSADYLNLFHVGLEVPREDRKELPKEVILKKIKEYYLPEPNPFVLEYYEEAIMRLW